MLRRPWVLVVALLLYAALLSAFATFAAYFVFDPIDGTKEAVDVIFDPGEWELDEPMWWAFCGAPALLIVVTQALFLWPLRGGEIQIRPDGKPLKKMVITAGLVAAVLTLALLFGVGAAVQLAWSVLVDQDPSEVPLDDDTMPFILLVIGVTLLASWIGWSILLSRFVSRDDPDTRFGRIVGLLFAGTVVETLVVLPIDIMVRRRTDCYCGTGGFYSLCLSAWALLWLCGPGAFLVFIRKRRRAWAETHCVNCGYVKDTSAGPLCPECGHSWKIRKAETPKR